MIKILLVTAITVASMSVSADINSCNYSLNYNIDVNDTEVRYSNSSADIIIFTENNLSINGNEAFLSKEQALSSNRFQTQTRELLPKIAEVVVEGAELGLKAVTITMAAIAGDGKNVDDDFIKPIKVIANKIKQNITDKSLNITRIEKLFDEELEQKIEELIEKMISKYSGKIISDVISSIFSSDHEDLKDFEFRMENLEHDIEQYVTSHAEVLEIKTEALCGTFEKLAELDRQLETIKGYPTGGLILNSSRKGLSISKFNVDF